MLRLALSRSARPAGRLTALSARAPLARSLCAAKPETGAPSSTTEGEPAGPSAAQEPQPDRITELEERLVELDEQLKAKHDQLLRALAEADNTRRRAAIDVENASKFAVGNFAKDLLDVADNLGRAMDAVPVEMRESEDHQDLKILFEGVRMTDTELLKVFAKHGLTKVDPLGEKFDPNYHNAMFEAPDPSKEPGTVMHVTSPGYKLHDRCLRAAGVGVVQKPSS
uniref:GrpE protein homolog n=1 Tax=Strombidinopsis acuminata TaxID=141414 RepID=A0A7S3RZI5_9SPIT|mmetsp:Transcript_19587/g.59285  ORF Transcript_19587/g.59285 Transcript_19587/m.59285 type:complete len:225 (-) Transcript_19587:507-1181(-)